MRPRLLTTFCALVLAAVATAAPRAVPPHRETVLSDGHGPECHAVTLAKAADGTLLAAWFSGAKEGTDDVVIRCARRDPRTREWTDPATVADHRGVPCWNPVLVPARDGSVTLYYKAAKLIPDWRGFWKRTTDHGATWTESRPLPEGFLGPIRCRPLALNDGSLLFGSSTESAAAGRPWRAHFEILSRPADPADASAWERVTPPPGAPPFNAIQPTVVRLPGGLLLSLVRTREKVVAETTSRDDGRTWSPLKATSLPNPNSGLEAAVLADGRAVLVLNHGPDRRTLDAVLRAADGTWSAPLLLDSVARSEVSYPSVLPDEQDGRPVLHVAYTRGRREIILRTFDLGAPEWAGR